MKVVGIITDWKRPDGTNRYGAIGWYRVVNPLEKLGQAWVGKLALGTPELALDLKRKGDIWFWKPVDNEGMNVDIDTARKFTGAKMVLDLDDEPFDLNPEHPLYAEITQKSERVKRMIEMADHVVVSTEPLKESVKHLAQKVTVIPNAIDPSIWKVKKPKKRTDGKVRIGWIASASHYADIDIIKDAFAEIAEKYPQVEIHVVGLSANSVAEENRYFLHSGTAGYAEFPQFMADLDLDIAVAPLKDTKFNRCKSNIKWLEHSMLEIPMVLSDVEPYSRSVTNYKTGYLAKNKAQWVKYLSWLVESEEKRKEIGKNAKKAVLKDWTIDKQLPKYEKLFQKLEAKPITVYTCLSGDFDHRRDPHEDPTAHYVAFTEGQSEAWDIRAPYSHFKSDRRNSRAPKLLPHLFLETEYSVYLDGNIRLKVPAQKLIDEFLKEKDVAVFRHMGRDSVYAEADACVALKKGDPKELAEQTKDYAKQGIPLHGWLAECGVIIRRHTKDVERMNEKWWAHYCRYSERDQVSFPVAFDEAKVNLIESSAWRHPYFEFVGHKHEKDNVRR